MEPPPNNGSIRRRLGTCLFLGLLLAVKGSATAKQGSESEEGPGPKIVLRVYNYSRLPSWLLWPALDRARFILAEAGVVVTPVVCTAHDAPALCGRAVDPLTVVLRFVNGLGPDRGPDTLGFATGAYVTVASRRVENLAGGSDEVLTQMLGCVAAHELGHVLLGSDAHSATGIMTAHYTEHEWTLMEKKLLWFLPSQATRMRANLLSRQGEVRAAGSHGVAQAEH